ncbi:transmembrane protein 168 isoform X2 [Callorhinus ursinus]|uniref:Transmembrane protein 168 n=1 Tax=Callorhinus ursinus TaxID=34884 RepID=A0A3Q7P5J6_CALUR|nr:transmembrane protein 168 isoform X2 [Callorhinus ursinus]XP_027960764.1 transmembrane protein 168 isoform X2 [Eumetopias jubatus]
MCKSLRYCFSHCLYLAMTRLEEVNREVNMHSSVRYLGYLARINLLVAICLGLYVRWEKTANSLILVIFILGLFVLGIASILYYYFSMEAASLSLSNLWFGFLLGLLCFLDNSSFKNDVKEESTKYLLLTSIVLRILCALVERISGYVHHRPTLLTTVEFLELVGFAIASTTMLVEKSLSVILLVVALAMLIIDLRMKSFLAIPNLVIFAVLLFFSSLETPKNPVAFACFFICLITDPFLDIYFSGLSVTERWKPFLYRGRICRRLSVVFTGMIELTFFILSAFKLRDTHLWYFVIPGFSIFGIFWMICHIIFLLTLWGFHTKLNDCHKVYFTHRVDNNSLDRIMASKGMRHFCLISEQLVFFSLLATAILGAVSWQPTNGIFLSMFLIVLPLESMAHGLFHELGNCLGGTSVGYAIVIPTNFCSGHTHGTGEWALAGGDILRLDTLLEWWREKNASFCSRLIIVLDSENSTPWVKEVRKINDQYIAVQGAEMTKTIDIEEADPPQLGDFTKDWVEYNCNPSNNICWTEKGRTVKAVYGVSKRWSDYTLHLPTGSDVAKHWMLHFPRITYPLVHLANWLCGLNLFWICKSCFRCLKRLKMSWFLPTVLDTGQGFKLVKS